MLDIFVGGAGDCTSELVKKYSDDYKAKYQSRQVRYFEWDEGDEILDYLKGSPDGERVNLIGHSYGGDTAGLLTIALDRKAFLLITVDPVGNTFHSTKLRIRHHCKHWVNVEAKPKTTDRSDVLAGLGHAWNQSVEHLANVHIVSGCHHREFAGLMKAKHPKFHRSAATYLEIAHQSHRLVEPMPTVKTHNR